MTPDELSELFLYEPDTGKLIYKKRVSSRAAQGSEAGSIGKHGYRSVEVRGKSYRVHRLIWFLMTGNWPHGEIDHIDRNKLNNKWSNLRVVNRAENIWNTERKNGSGTSSGYEGVRKRGNSYQAHIRHMGKRVVIGSFPTAEEALKARDDAVMKYRGDCYARSR